MIFRSLLLALMMAYTSEDCGTGCIICINEDKICTSCEEHEGYYLTDQSGGLCCSTKDDSFPDSNGGCNNCATLNSQCATCKYDLARLTVICDTCPEGLYLTQEGGCMTCQELIPGCAGCMILGEMTICATCENGFQQTTQSTSCCEEQKGYYADSNNGCLLCVDTMEGCKNCKLNGQNVDCQACITEDGYILSQSKCCSSNNHYFPDGSGDCELCQTQIEGCSECSFDSSITCKTCNKEEGYTSDGNGGCMQCPTGCTSCDGQECSSCDTDSGFKLSGTSCCDTQQQSFPDGQESCQSCSSLLPFCPECAWEEDSLVCIQCEDILNNCKKCSDSTTCTECESDFHLKNGECKACQEWISECQSCSDANNCQKCKQGFVLTSPSSCQSCNSGEVLNEAGDACVPCQSIDEQCQTCSNENTCSSCSAGLTLTEQGKCQQCPEGSVARSDNTCFACFAIDQNCVTCSDENTCTSCSSGYWISQGECSPCSTIDPQCTTCSSNGCSTCSDGFFWDGSICQTCSTFCEKCSSDSNCLQCSLGFVAQNGICTRCRTGLTQCSASDLSSPSTCDDGFYQQGGSCHLCPNNCYLCSDPSVCQVCQPGFSLQGNICQPCSGEGCESCAVGMFSEINSQGQKVGDCYPCSEDYHCDECRGNAAQCTVCQEGYDFLGFTCVLETRLTFVLTLEEELGEFQNRGEKFRTAFIEALDSPAYLGRQELIHFQSLVQGSTIIDGQLEILDGTSAAIYRKVENFTINSIQGFNLISISDLTPINFQKPVNQEEEEIQVERFPVYGIILLIIIPLLMIIIIVGVCLMKKSPFGTSTTQTPLDSNSVGARSTTSWETNEAL